MEAESSSDNSFDPSAVVVVVVVGVGGHTENKNGVQSATSTVQGSGRGQG